MLPVYERVSLLLEVITKAKVNDDGDWVSLIPDI